MASYVMPIGSDEDAFLEETQNLVLKMLGLVPSDLEFDNEFDEGEIHKRVNHFEDLPIFRPQRVTLQAGDFEVHGSQITQFQQNDVVQLMTIDNCDDLECDDVPTTLSETLPCYAETRISTVESTEEERKIEEVVEKLEKMAEQFSSIFKEDFMALEEDLYTNDSYSSFRSLMGKIIPAPNPMWYKISMLLGISRYLVREDKKKKSKHVSGITSFTVEYIKENFADYIIENGGWDSVASVSLQEIEGEIFCEISDMEKAAFEGILPPQDATNEAMTDGKPSSDPEKEDGSQEEDAKEDQGAGDSTAVMGSSLFDLSPFIATATAAAVAVAYAVMKT